jgi:hypothetical protein
MLQNWLTWEVIQRKYQLKRRIIIEKINGR